MKLWWSLRPSFLNGGTIWFSIPWSSSRCSFRVCDIYLTYFIYSSHQESSMSEFETLECIHPNLVNCLLLWGQPSENFKENFWNPKKCPSGQLCRLVGGGSWCFKILITHQCHRATDIWEVTVADRPCWPSRNQRWTSSAGSKMSCWLGGSEAECPPWQPV